MLNITVLLARYPEIFYPYDPIPLTYPFPAKVGFDAVLSKKVIETLNRIKTVIQKFILGRNEVSRKTHKTLPLLEKSEWGYLIYSVPGSGKTRLIESLLSKHWGFYFITGNLTTRRSHRSADENSQNIYTARRDGHSKDLHYLWRLVQLYHRTFPGIALRAGALKYWFYLLYYSRHLILNAFIEQSKRCQNAPKLWLQFQKEKDPFSALFWALVVQSPSFRKGDLEDEISALPKLIASNPSFFICLDKAQIDLNATVKLGLKATKVQYSHTLFESFLSESVAVLRSWKQFPVRSARFVVSGTSLKLKEIQAELEKSAWGLIKLKPYTDFPLLTTDESFEQLLSEKGLPLDTIGLKIKETILEQSRRLRGRYLWCVLYIESLKERINHWKSQENQHAYNIDQVIKEVAKKVMDRAKKDLKDHLKNIQSPDLKAHLCWIVVCCEILDRKKVIAEDGDNEMIEQGFATVCKESKDGKLKGSLEENLALEAALE